MARRRGSGQRWQWAGRAAWLVLVPAVALAQGKGGKGGKTPRPEGSAAAPAPTAAPSAPAGGLSTEARKEQARVHFERGIALSDEEAWDAALVEFARSRELFPSRGNTKNLALSLRKLQRFDEALDMYERLLSEISNLSAQDKAFADKEIDELKKRVGVIEIQAEAGASVTIGSRTRGTTPLPGGIRLSAGSHVVRVYKEGYVPFETRVDVLGGQTAKLDAKLVQLAQAGKLRVSEQKGQQVDVEIDHTVVGKTPWEGSLPPGEHTVVLKGEGNLGTQPASVPVQLNQVATLTLAVEPLESEVRVEPSPVNATVAIDGVSVGRGLWVGRLRTGNHTIEVGAEGFLPERRQVSLKSGPNEVLSIPLERDPNSPLWRRVEPARFVVGAAAFGLVGSAIGGEVTDGCGSGCSGGVPLGGRVVVRGGYELGSGFGFGVELGYLGVRQKVENRAEALRPVGLPDNPGQATDALTLQGFNAGGSLWYRRGKPWGWAVQLSSGVVLGTVRDQRSGSFTTATSKQASGAFQPYDISTIIESSPARYLYVAPEARVSYRFAAHAEVGFGLQVAVLVALLQSRWEDRRPLLTGTCSLGGSCVTDGQARFGQKTTSSQLTVLAAPGASLKFDF